MMKDDIRKITETIIALDRKSNDRWNKGDVNGALDIYSDDVSYFDPLTETRLDGRKVVEAYFRQFYAGKVNILRNEFCDTQVIVSDGGDLAVLTYKLLNYVPDGKGGEKPGPVWNATQVFRRIDSTWLVVHVNWSFTRHPAVVQALTA